MYCDPLIGTKPRQLALVWTLHTESRRVIEELLADPERRSNVHYDFRYWPVQRFPHLILYDVTPSEILLFGVMHPSQEPDQWIARRG